MGAVEGTGSPSVSVITPMYNAESTIARCVASVLAQTREDFELLVVDNNSRDRSVRTCRDAMAGDARARILAETRQGVGAARDRGLAEARGEYVFFLDADDEITPDALEKLLAEASACDADMVVAGVEHLSLDAAGQVRERAAQTAMTERFAGQTDIARAFARRLPQHGMFGVFALYRRQMIETYGLRFDPEAALGENLLFNLAALRCARRVSLLGEPVYRYYHPYGDNQSVRYRADLLAIKRTLLEKTVEYLSASGCWDEEARQAYYAMCAREVFALVANIFRNPAYQSSAARREFGDILALPDVREMLRRGKSLALPRSARVLLRALQIKSFALARLGARALRAPNRP